MRAIIQSEWYKLRKSKIAPIILIGPAITILIGLMFNFAIQGEINEWYLLLLSVNFTYALLFLPLITGVLAGIICRYEHQAGGWKQLLALPVTRVKVFVGKYMLLMVIVLVIQLLYLGAIFLTGMIQGITDPFPIEIVWKSALGGWVATFPLVALQLWMSMVFNSFAAPLTVNVIFTLPAILAINSERFGPYYPWAQPFSMMYIGENSKDIFFVPWDQLLTVVGGSFILFFLGGLIYFQRKMV
ncbi:ABC transporter permease [Bacillaceae bacterium W0354]